MEDTGGEKDNSQPQLTLEQRSQLVSDLSRKFGGSSNIPKDELSNLGYAGVQQGDVFRLLPLELMAELFKKDPDWEKPIKARERPFEQITIELPTSDFGFRFIPRRQQAMLTQKLQDVDYAFYPNWEDGPTELRNDQGLKNLSAFLLDFLAYMNREGIDGRRVSVELAEDLLFTVLPSRLGVAFREDSDRFNVEHPNNFSCKNFLDTYSAPDGSVTSGESKRMYDELTRLGGYFTDVSELADIFQSKIVENFPQIPYKDSSHKSDLDHWPVMVENGLTEEDLAWREEGQKRQELEEYLESIGIKTYADAIRYVFPRYLEHVGLIEIGKEIEKNPNLHKAAGRLRSLDASDSSLAEEKRLRAAIKTATPEERSVLSKSIKSLEEEKKRRRQIRQGVIDYFSSPEVYADIVRRKVKAAQDFLVAGMGEKAGHALFFLDATSNAELDADPGLVSGDCTAGRPLPFNRSDIPLYNVKVFANDMQHVGNMYLLVTKASTELAGKKKVWHFDAMQIPSKGINWKESIALIVRKLSEQAKTMGIDAITANAELHHISNYDYIANAVKECWDEHGRQRVRVTIPKVGGSGNSSLQGTGEAIVLWSNVRLSGASEGELENEAEMFNLQ